MDAGNEFGFVQTYLPQHVIAIRLLIAAILGAMIGIEREWHTAEAGLRTHILVATAASLFTILAFEIYHGVGPGSSGARADPIRAVEAVTAGIAFLGAGAIFKTGNTVQGLTTGAGMWLAGAVGVATALGYYLIAFGVALLAVIVLAALRVLAHNIIRRREADAESPGPEGGRGEKR
ncbi:MgtC/SapB family protein [Devosia sp.]|uniref:MgtC/SapB family protein n=2 Tax=Devosia sp. TaxID=1871048 RepID=UPI00292FDA15|nr:MgtC/SapB family protein [Devosia sp.]